jgi:Skp family chaperone for outer membrane proteins
MRRRMGWTVMAAGVVGAAVLWAASRGGAQGTAAPTGRTLRVAVVNLKQASDTCKRYQDLRSLLEKHREQKLAALKQKRDELDKLQADLKAVVKDTPTWRDLMAQATRLEVEIRVLGDLSVKELQAENLEFTARIYDSLIAEIDRYAKANGIDLVLRVGESEAEAATLEDLYRKMAARVVLYSSGPIDMTDEVLRAADRTYDAERR